ncbi:MAG: O-acetyl-ADP-ribose deacetylase [Bacteroidetes bacterium]|nr:O-acetyl-ADP-ribose deacetylase [Bacteroidota bacterium]
MKIELIKGDITKIEVDAIVNAANSGLRGGGGVDGAIHRAGGPSIMEECKRIRETEGGCPTGEAVLTSAGNLPAKYVIHTVGPIWSGGNRGEAELLKSAYSNSLKLAKIQLLHSVTFPNISTGVYGFPKELAATIALEAVREFMENNDLPTQAIFVCFDDENYSIYNNLL